MEGIKISVIIAFIIYAIAWVMYIIKNRNNLDSQVGEKDILIGISFLILGFLLFNIALAVLG